MRVSQRLRVVLALGLLCPLMIGTAAGQSDRGTLAGTILDSSGAVVSQAAITVTGVDTGTVYDAVSGSGGVYRIQDIKVGAYNVKAAATGFKTAERTGVVIQVNTVSALDITMQIGSAQETMTVLADAPAIQTESSDIGTVVGTRQIQELPLALAATGQSHLRSAEAFVFLTPGTAGPGTDDSSGIFVSKLSGGQNFATEVLLDGASIVHAELGSTFDENAPSLEALSEFKVMTSTIPAEFGRTTGGVESFSTKSGTNAWHGTGFLFFRNDKWNANSWRNNFFGLPKPRDHQKDYGGSLGGPIRIPRFYDGHDKTFFFFSWEQYRNFQGASSVATLPTDVERTGDFSALLGPALQDGNGNPVLNPCDGTQVFKGQIFDPSTTQTVGGVRCRTAFPGNKIPGPLSTVAQNVLGFLTVHPNVTPSPANENGLIQNFAFNSVNPIYDTTMSFRIDHNLATNHKLFFSYSSRDQEQLNGTPNLPGLLDPNFFKSRFSHYIRFGWDDTISPTLLNHLNIGFNRLNDPSRGVSNIGQDWEKTLGISGASGVYFPVMQFQGSPLNIGYQQLSGGNADIAIPNSLIVSDSVSWTRGRHSLRFGFEWRHSQFSRINNANTSPTFTFQPFQTQLSDTIALGQTGDPFASFLLGLPNEETLSISSVNPRWNQNSYAGYVQDDFRFRRNLTFNLGLRYDVDTPRHEAHKAQSVFDPTAQNCGNAAVPISPCVPGALIYGPDATGAKTYYKDFGPRIGFAYSPDWVHNTVLRGGYGIIYAALSYSDFGDALTSGTKATPDFKSLDSFTPVQPLDQGFPAFTPPSNAKDPAFLNGNNSSPFFVGADYGRPGMVQNWSLEVQHQLLTDLILSVGYIGSHSTRLHSLLVQENSLNSKFFPLGTKLTDPVTSPAGQATLAGLGVSVPDWFIPLFGDGVQVGQLLRPFPQYSNSIDTASNLENKGQSTYNALQTKLERRFRNGINLLASYTYSKTLTDADTAFPFFTGGNSGVFGAQNPNNLKAEKSVSFQDIGHAFVLSYLYEIPVGPGKKFLNHGVASKVLGGWEISGVHRYQSGTPVMFNEFASSAPFTTNNFRFSQIPGVPLISPNASHFKPLNGPPSGCNENADGTFSNQIDPATNQPSTNNYFNCAAFLDPNASSLVAQRGYVFGNLPQAISYLRNPGYVNEDFSIIKNTRLFESNTLTFKVDIPNAFNRHVFGRRDGVIGDGTFGVPGYSNFSSANVLNAPRNIQVTLRYQF
jgi:outer membrane receptor protein involved in Fe transport